MKPKLKTPRPAHRLPPEKLYARLDPETIPFETTAELASYRGMIGQDRAMRAVELGLRVRTRGFNIFAVGDPGSGKTSTLERLLEERAAREPVPDDLCYVYNFEAPDRPESLCLPAGKGRALSRDMERMVSELERMIPRVLSEGSFGHIRAGIVADTRRRAHDLTRRASQAAEKLGLQIEEGDDGLRVSPLVDGQPIDQAAFEQLPPARRRRIETSMNAFHEHLESFSYGRRQLERDHNTRLLEAEVRAVTPVVEDVLGEVAARYRRYAGGLEEYLGQVKEHILANHRQFLPPEEGRGEAQPPELTEPLEDPRVLYHVNVVVDRSSAKGAPVVVERVPTPSNLCGCFEYRETQGGLVTDHTLVRAGSLHQANGGYLLIQASDLLTNEMAWDCLKRALRHKEIRVEEGAGMDQSRPRVAGSMKPGTVPLKVKVILVGTTETYYFLKIEDEDFGRLFKIKADFETTMPRTRENVLRLGRFLGQVCREEGYLPLHRSGVARIVEVSSRRAEHQQRMCTRRAETLDVLAEANLFAREAGVRSIRGSHVEAALLEARHRNGRIEEAVDLEIREGAILIRTRGFAVGQLNGIALYDLAGTMFGVPVRITARTYVGKRGVVNIDREVNLSGAIHDKGALILVGYLGGRYAQEEILALSASITFEQSYDEIDGDSASSAELYALLSSLSGCPVRQGVAVTGSVNQLGEVQPIGGVNEKIESIFRVCRNRGLTGEEGVMIPASNVRNLMLDREVVDAVRCGDFSIYAVETIDEGIEVLTGVRAGARRKDGTWEPGSINAKVAARLAELSDIVRRKGVLTAMDREI
ncbi:MAG: ATP-binding protein [Deltaproteobacteria bacterium]|nr:ATP-binding protein [Deltaproteobacteria bacterium]